MKKLFDNVKETAIRNNNYSLNYEDNCKDDWYYGDGSGNIGKIEDICENGYGGKKYGIQVA